MKVKDVMTSDALCCSSTDTLQKAAYLMWTHDVGALPVTDSSGRPIAMVTDRDIAMHAAIRGRRLADLSVSGCMSGTLWSCTPNDTLAAAEKSMREHQVSRLPVLAGGKIQGVVTLHDIARGAEGKDDSVAVAKTYGAIARRRSSAQVSGPAATAK